MVLIVIGILAAKELESKHGIRCNMTLIFNKTQVQCFLR
jgi:transaldolase